MAKINPLLLCAFFNSLKATRELHDLAEDSFHRRSSTRALCHCEIAPKQ